MEEIVLAEKVNTNLAPSMGSLATQKMNYFSPEDLKNNDIEILDMPSAIIEEIQRKNKNIIEAKEPNNWNSAKKSVERDIDEEIVDEGIEEEMKDEVVERKGKNSDDYIMEDVVTPGKEESHKKGKHILI
jgi:hypothetical protein